MAIQVGDLILYRIEDGETNWFAARNEDDAIQVFLETYGMEVLEFDTTVTIETDDFMVEQVPASHIMRTLSNSGIICSTVDPHTGTRYHLMVSRTETLTELQQRRNP